MIEELGETDWEGENPQRVIVPNNDDDDDDDDDDDGNTNEYFWII